MFYKGISVSTAYLNNYSGQIARAFCTILFVSCSATPPSFKGVICAPPVGFKYKKLPLVGSFENVMMAPPPGFDSVVPAGHTS